MTQARVFISRSWAIKRSPSPQDPSTSWLSSIHLRLSGNWGPPPPLMLGIRATHAVSYADMLISPSLIDRSIPLIFPLLFIKSLCSSLSDVFFGRKRTGSDPTETVTCASLLLPAASTPPKHTLGEKLSRYVCSPSGRRFTEYSQSDMSEIPIWTGAAGGFCEIAWDKYVFLLVHPPEPSPI